MTKRIRVRYAPSPTGFLHIGGARTALFNYLFAKHYNGDFIVRLEDTDIERHVEGGETSQLENLRWLGIIPDESVDIGGEYGPYRQMERLEIYKDHVQKLIDTGQAYKCFCSVEDLAISREKQKVAGFAPMYVGKCRTLSPEEIALKELQCVPYTVRIRVPENKTYNFVDLVRGEVVFQSKDIGDWIIMKANGIPTYNFAVALDDHFMEISHVFRGEEHLSNTPKQIMVYEVFGWDSPQFGHMTLIVNEERKKLSKRDETIVQFVSQYKNLGFLPEALFNFFALLGWSPETDKEILSKEELTNYFDGERLSKSVSMFDKKKLLWMNSQYIKLLSKENFIKFVFPYLEQTNMIPKTMKLEQFESIVCLFQEQLTYAQEIVELVAPFLKEQIHYTELQQELLKRKAVIGLLGILREKISLQNELTNESIKLLLKEVELQSKMKGKELYLPIRIAITGEEHGPDLTEVIKLIGKDKAIKRLENILNSEISVVG